MTQTHPDDDALLEMVHGIEPVIGEHRAWQEEHRRMAPEVFEALRAAGLWGIFKPAELGGMECDPVTGLKVFEEITRIEGDCVTSPMAKFEITWTGAWH